jgi:hypothetical protein
MAQIGNVRITRNVLPTTTPTTGVVKVPNPPATGGSGLTTTTVKTVIETYDFNLSTLWRVSHNKNTKKFIEKLTNSQGNRIYAQINIIDSNTFDVLLTEATAGTVTVIFA